MHAKIIHEKYTPNASKTNISLTCIMYLPIWTSRQCNGKWRSSLPSLKGCLFSNRFQFGCVFPRQQKQSSWNEGLIPRAVLAQLWGMRASFCGTEWVNESDSARRQKKREGKKPAGTHSTAAWRTRLWCWCSLRFCCLRMLPSCTPLFLPGSCCFCKPTMTRKSLI